MRRRNVQEEERLASPARLRSAGVQATGAKGGDMSMRAVSVMCLSLLLSPCALAQEGLGSGWAAGGAGERGVRGLSGPQAGEDASGREAALPDILRSLRARYGGQHLDASRVGSLYRISWLTEDGRRLMIEVDAATGRSVSVRG